MLPLVSVIIPTNNRASVEAQTCRDFEIPVVDDGSTDATLKALAPLKGVKDVDFMNFRP